MTSIELHVDLIPEKYTEFIQSWHTFIGHVRNNEGLIGFDLNQSDQSCDIVLRWQNDKYLKDFVEGKWYAFISGAIDVLGESSNISFTNTKN